MCVKFGFLINHNINHKKNHKKIKNEEVIKKNQTQNKIVSKKTSIIKEYLTKKNAIIATSLITIGIIITSIVCYPTEKYKFFLTKHKNDWILISLNDNLQTAVYKEDEGGNQDVIGIKYKTFEPIDWNNYTPFYKIIYWAYPSHDSHYANQETQYNITDKHYDISQIQSYSSFNKEEILSYYPMGPEYNKINLNNINKTIELSKSECKKYFNFRAQAYSRS